jgi:hypothetical protein
VIQYWSVPTGGARRNDNSNRNEEKLIEKRKRKCTSAKVWQSAQDEETA